MRMRRRHHACIAAASVMADGWDSDGSDFVDFSESMSAREVSAWLQKSGIPEKFSKVFEGK